MASAEEESKSPSNSLYSKFILAAISALGEERSNKSEIFRYIESTYGEDLPDDHEEPLSEALEEMKENGEILLRKNNYVRAYTPAPRRSRGRPPKPKQPLPPGVDPPTPRPRGRPPKPKDPLTAAFARAVSGLPRPRGRPPSKHRPAVMSSPSKAKAPVMKPAVSGVKRGRGRPPKSRVPETDMDVE